MHTDRQTGRGRHASRQTDRQTCMHTGECVGGNIVRAARATSSFVSRLASASHGAPGPLTLRPVLCLCIRWHVRARVCASSVPASSFVQLWPWRRPQSLPWTQNSSCLARLDSRAGPVPVNAVALRYTRLRSRATCRDSQCCPGRGALGLMRNS